MLIDNDVTSTVMNTVRLEGVSVHHGDALAVYNTNERMSYSFFGMPNCFTLVATQVPLGISKKE